MNTTSQRQLTRSRDGRMVAGVCAGLAKYTNTDPTIIRLVAIVVTIFLAGIGGVVLYALAVLIIPEEGSERTIAQDLLDKANAQRGQQDVNTPPQDINVN
jgi:phage shock protein PspC (stress-responsive transcriptional regulator)